MPEEESKREEEKLEFTPEGEFVGYISLDQARVLALRHARDNPEFYGRRYARRELAWDVLSEEEREDFYYIRLSFRPARGFRGEPGVELFTIDKAGPVELRQIISEPQAKFNLTRVILVAAVLVAAGGIVGGLAGAGVFSSESAEPTEPTEPTDLRPFPRAVGVALLPRASAKLFSTDGNVTVDLPVASVNRPALLRYLPVTLDQLPRLPLEYLPTEKLFDLTLTNLEETDTAPVFLDRPILLSVRLSGRDIAESGGDAANVSIQHYEEDSGWTPLSTEVDFAASIARAKVDSLSLFALTIRRQDTAPLPAAAMTATPVPRTLRVPSATSPSVMITTPTPIPGPTATPASTASRPRASTSTPESVPFPTAIPTPTPTRVPKPTSTPVLYFLETAISPVDLGTIDAVPVSVDQLYPSGTVVGLTARCNLGFTSWTGDVPLGVSPFSNPITVTMDTDRVLVAMCDQPSPTPTSVPTSTPEPRYTLSINGFVIGPGQGTMAVGNGTIVLSQPPDADGTYLRETVLTLRADTGGRGAQVYWTGVDSESGDLATIEMVRIRNISVFIVPSRQPTPTPTPLPQLILPGTVIPTPTPVPTPTPTLAPGVTPTITPTPTPVPGPSTAGRIAFYSSQDGDDEIYVLNADGSSQTRLTNQVLDDRYPSWSPDATRIAFASGRDGGELQIYVMNSDGSSLTRVTNNSASESRPAWSPDGTKIAFESNRDGGSEIYVMNSDGSAQTRLTNNSAGDVHPTWSPNGTKIAFTSSRDGNEEIYIMNSDGSGQTRLTNNSASDQSPSWSSSGAKIAFDSTRDGNWEIYVMNSDGSGQTNLTNHPFGDLTPSWSTDGARIAFTSVRDGGNAEIYTMNTDGSDQNRVTNSPGSEQEPDWGP